MQEQYSLGNSHIKAVHAASYYCQRKYNRIILYYKKQMIFWKLVFNGKQDSFYPSLSQWKGLILNVLSKLNHSIILGYSFWVSWDFEVMYRGWQTNFFFQISYLWIKGFDQESSPEISPKPESERHAALITQCLK